MTDGQSYIGIRVTISHDRLDDIKSMLLHDVDEWCIYKHGGNGTTRAEHLHIAAVGGNPERYRKRLRDNIGGGTKVYTVKQFNNDVRSFVFYCAHESTEPIYQGSLWEERIKSVAVEGCYKKRVDDHFEPSEKRVLDRDWTLTYTNLVPQAVLYRRKYMKGEESLKRVVESMIRHTKWRPSRDMYKNGVPPVYQRDFEFRIGVRADPDMDWWEPKSFT